MGSGDIPTPIFLPSPELVAGREVERCGVIVAIDRGGLAVTGVLGWRRN